jgi:hypothetical protein
MSHNITVSYQLSALHHISKSVYYSDKFRRCSAIFREDSIVRSSACPSVAFNRCSGSVSLCRAMWVDHVGANKTCALDTDHIKILKIFKIRLKISCKPVTCSSKFCAGFSQVALYGRVWSSVLIMYCCVCVMYCYWQPTNCQFSENRSVESRT